MSDRPRRIPKYRFKKSLNQAVVTLTIGPGVRRDYPLGPMGSKASHEKYERLIAEWLASGHRHKPQAGVTVNELIDRFRVYAEQHYVTPDGTPTAEIGEYRTSLRPVREMYGTTLATDFDQLALKAVRQVFIAAGCCRRFVNRRVGRIRRVFKWAAGEKLIPASVLVELATVAGLPYGRSKAPETEPVAPVSEAAVDEIRPFASRHVWGLIEFQRFTGCRPGEACVLRACDIDMTGDVWIYRPQTHENAWRQEPRTICLGKNAQAIVREFLTTRLEDYLFSPRLAREEWFAAKRARRKTKVQPSQANRAKRQPKRSPGERYTTRSYAHAIARACQRAGIDPWSPNQLRHSFATMVRKIDGLEGAQAALGHSRADVTQIYAERDLQRAIRIAREVG
jgi:integrase